MAYVYRHIRLDLNVPFYIGIGLKEKTIDTYYKRAHNKAQRSQRWKNISNKTAIEVEIMLDDLSYHDAKAKEIELIHLYKRVEQGGTLVNLTDGGDGTIGWIPSDEVRKKLSDIHKGRASHLRGTNLTDEHKIKLSAAHKGRTSHRKGKKIPRHSVEKMRLTNLSKIPVQQFKDGILIAEFPNFRIASNETGLRKGSINAVLNGHRKTHKGYTWKYKKSPGIT